MTTLTEKDKDRVFTLHILCMECIVSSLVFSFIYAYAGSPKTGLLFLSAVPLTALTYFVLQLLMSPAAAGNWILGFGYILFLVSAYWTGGIQAPVLYWSSVLPVVGALICGRRSAVVWLVLVLGKISFFYWIDKTGIWQLPLSPFIGESQKMVLYTSMVGILLVVFFPVLVTEGLKERYLKRLEEKNRELREALENVHVLRGMLPICSWCHNVRNDKGYWDRIETYLMKHSKVEFSHGICPTCQAREMKKLDLE